MAGQVAQLAGFIDQAGLFRTPIAIANKLHFVVPPLESLVLLGKLLGTLAGEIQLPRRIAGLRLLAEGWE